MKINLSYIVLFFAPLLYGQAPGLEWQKTVGGSNYDEIFSMIQTSTGDLVAVGQTDSQDGDITDAKGEMDGLVVKLDSSGNIIWSRTLGGSDNDAAYSVILMPDLTYMVLAGTWSTDGDVEGNDGSWNLWLVQLDTNGQIIWQKIIETERSVNPNSLLLAPDGYYITGSGGAYMNNDYFFMKVNMAGESVVEKYYGGSKHDPLNKTITTSDGNILLAGVSNSIDGDRSESFGGPDIWLVMINDSGDIIWEKSFGGSGIDVCNSIVETADNHYAAVGVSEEIGTWIYKISPLGDLVWQTIIESEFYVTPYDIIQAEDFNYAVTGAGKVKDFTLPNGKMWIGKIDSIEGELLWENRFGASSEYQGPEVGFVILQTDDKGYVMGGIAGWSSDGDATGHHGATDGWIVKTHPDHLYTTEVGLSTFTYYPNPAKDYIYFSQKLKNPMIFDLQGKSHLQVTGNSEYVDVSGLPSGIYILKGTDEFGKMISVKVLKE